MTISLTADVVQALARSSLTVIEFGKQLRAEKKACPYGTWLPYLTETYPELKLSSITNYMRAARFAEQYPNVNFMNLEISVLYFIARKSTPYSIVERVIKLAEQRMVCCLDVNISH